MSQSPINNNKNCFNVTNQVNVCNCSAGDGRSQILNWLSSLEPRLRHRDLQERRVENVGEWFMQTKEFRRWYDGSGEVEDDKAVLFCCGNPGVGKTFISSLVVDRLCDKAGGQNASVACFYFDFVARKEQSATSTLGSLIKQIVRGMESIPEEVSRIFREQKVAIGGRGPQLHDLVKMLQAITSSQRTFICIDALDECAAVHRAKLLDALKQILEKSPGTRIFVTGRPHIRVEIERRLAGRVIGVSVGPTRDDITRYLRTRLSEDETPDAMDEILEADILQRIPENISEMFLLVSLNIKAILQESTIYRRRGKLREMTSGLGLEGAYGATIERIRAQGGDKSRLGMGALMWISHAERPLQLDELCHALAVELGTTDFNASNIPSMSTLLSCCQGLITVDKEASTVRLIHFTLQEYLSAHPDIFSRPHSTIAEICLTYLNSRQAKALPADHPLVTQQPSFLEYCAVYWGVHAKRELSESARSLALKLLQENDSDIYTKFLLAQIRYFCLWGIDTWSPFNGLHCASFFGITEIVDALIEMGCDDINGGDVLGCTPLAWAAHNGHEETVKTLLRRRDVDPNKPNNEGQTPLSFAAGHGHEGVVKILLGLEEVDPDRPNSNGRTPLSYAAGYGHEGVVKILLMQDDVNVDKPDDDGRTPLLFAASHGREGVVKILLGREEVNPDRPHILGRTPLSFAAGHGREGVVKMLLGRGGVNPDQPGTDGLAPLSLTAHGGHEEVVKILLGRKEVKPDRPGNGGRTPLSIAAEGGHEGVVKILLGQEDVDADKPDGNGRTPLSYAAGYGHEEMVKILLMREEVNADTPDDDGRTPLLFAAWHGREGVVKILLARKEVNPDQPDRRGQTPLSFAAWNGHERVVKILLEQGGVNPGKLGDNGRTPLSYAASTGHERVVKMLLEQKEVNPDRPNNNGRTPLSYAAGYGHEGAVKILLMRDEVNADKPDDDGGTPLLFAARHGREGVVKILLARKEVNPDQPDRRGQTPLSFAAWNGHERVVKILLGRDGVNPGRPDNDGQTPLSYATSGERQGVIALLQSYKAATTAAI